MSIFGPGDKNLKKALTVVQQNLIVIKKEQQLDNKNLTKTITAVQKELNVIKKERLKPDNRHVGACNTDEFLGLEDVNLPLGIQFYLQRRYSQQYTRPIGITLRGGSKYKIVTRYTQNETISHFKDSGTAVGDRVFNIDHKSLTDEKVLTDVNVLIESLFWIKGEVVVAPFLPNRAVEYKFYLVLYGVYEEDPKCYYYDIKHLEL